MARDLPLDAPALETDEPDMTAIQSRGQLNSPEYIPCVLRAMASVRTEPPEEIPAATARNTALVLGLPVESPENHPS